MEKQCWPDTFLDRRPIKIWLFLFLYGRQTFQWCAYPLDKQKAVRGIKEKQRTERPNLCYTMASFPIVYNALLYMLLLCFLLYLGFCPNVTSSEKPSQTSTSKIASMPPPIPYSVSFSLLHWSLTWPCNCLHTWLVYVLSPLPQE